MRIDLRRFFSQLSKIVGLLVDAGKLQQKDEKKRAIRRHSRFDNGVVVEIARLVSVT